MNWFTYQITRALCLIAHLFQRPDLARLEILERELYRLRLRIGDRTVELREMTDAYQKEAARVDQLEKILSTTISDRLDSRCHILHRNDQ